MTRLGLVETGLQLSPTPPLVVAKLQLRVEDALASARRLWVRGRLVGLEQLPKKEQDPRWWQRVWGKSEETGSPPTATLETHVSGAVLQASVPIRSDGRFEALFEVNFPPARRGWRMARNCLTIAKQKLEACGIVIMPPHNAPAAIVVILPLAYSRAKNGPQELAQSEQAARLVPVLQRLQQHAIGRLPIYYLAGVTGNEETRQAELALAATTLGFPPGNFLLVADSPAGIKANLAQAIDRLRWLFAGTVDLRVINLESTAVPWLGDQCQPGEDRALVRQVVHPEENLWALLDESEKGTGVKGQKTDRASNLRPPTSAMTPRPTRASRVTRYPIVFCHGMLAFTALRLQLPADLNYFSHLREFLKQRGFRVLYPQVSPTSGVVVRANQLYEQITRWTNEPVNIIAHSMGGLDARYLISHLGLADQVRSLTTVSTPHRGTYVADWFTANFRQRFPLLLALEALGFNVDGFGDCRLAICQEFNATTPDMPGVRYFSYGGEVTGARLSPVLRRAWNILSPVEGPCDGMVSVASARWGDYLGTISADHFAQTPDAMYLRPGEDFDSLGFFSRLVEDLARRGF